MLEERRILLTGQVQGVGFRYTTHRIASGYRVTGYVRNLDDGRVELVAEGEKTEIDGLLAELRTHFANNIQDESQETRTYCGLRHGFEILR